MCEPISKRDDLTRLCYLLKNRRLLSFQTKKSFADILETALDGEAHRLICLIVSKRSSVSFAQDVATGMVDVFK